MSDQHSDLDYYAYVRPGQSLDPSTFVGAWTPLLLSVVNEFGTPNFVTPELHRIELHVQPVSQLSELLGWPVFGPDLTAMLIKDDDGTLAQTLQRWAAGPAWKPDEPQLIYDRVLNWLVFTMAVRARGEYLRAAELLTWIRGGLLRLARFAEQVPQFPAVTRFAERDLGPWAQRVAALETGHADVELLALEICRELAAALGLDERLSVLAALRDGQHQS
ncbi:hypothetical protein [Deinococcus alpinitundrae]|uniref:hypothetical protein n=1 Tax=Deinococcus alpinitundrae TaxID=468913 RepID=UPI001ED95CE7|nr:hypothetical protein [Deinococcus alpinitundrae]